MASWQLELQSPPKEPRAFELWLQHAAGRILIEDVRANALEKIGPELSAEARGAEWRISNYQTAGYPLPGAGVQHLELSQSAATRPKSKVLRSTGKNRQFFAKPKTGQAGGAPVSPPGGGHSPARPGAWPPFRQRRAPTF